MWDEEDEGEALHAGNDEEHADDDLEYAQDDDELAEAHEGKGVSKEFLDERVRGASVD